MQNLKDLRTNKKAQKFKQIEKVREANAKLFQKDQIQATNFEDRQFNTQNSNKYNEWNKEYKDHFNQKVFRKLYQRNINKQGDNSHKKAKGNQLKKGQSNQSQNRKLEKNWREVKAKQHSDNIF